MMGLNWFCGTEGLTLSRDSGGMTLGKVLKLLPHL